MAKTARPPAAPGLDKNNTSYPVQVSARLRDLYEKYTKVLADEKDPGHLEAAGLKYYQYLVREVMTNPEYGLGERGNGRGLLVYHSMGMGKTFLAVATAMAMWDVRPPLVVVAKSLRANIVTTVEKYVAMLDPGLRGDALAVAQRRAVARFTFVSLDAYNMASQVAKATTGTEGSGTISNKLLIIDEAHNLFRAVINSPNDKTNARRLYNMVMGARNLRILFLTGTPASKDPFELVPCFNMLAGYEILPTQYDAFYRSYVDREGKGVRNRGKLANRLLGLVSHVSHSLPAAPRGDYRDGAEGPPKKGFPTETPTTIERVEMSREQYTEYLQAREKEEAEGKGGSGGRAPPTDRIPNTPALSLPGSEAGGGSTYHVKSRTLSNFAPPAGAKDLAVKDMPPGAFSAETSPKVARLVENVRRAGGPVLIYSQFVDVGGLAVVERFLQGEKYKAFDPQEPRRPAGGPRYATISGDVRPEDRARIQEVFNSPGNAHGELIRALLVSKTGAEGLDLKGVRQIHILEPYWDKSREDQVKARGVRLGSHDHLPLEEREVSPFLYIAVANAEMFRGMQPTPKEDEAPPQRYRLLEEETIDESFHKRALDRQKVNEAFRRLLREVCLECAVNGYGGCRQCVPTDAPLFHEDPARDLRLPDPCRAIAEEEVDAEEIFLGEDRYFFRREPARLFGVAFYDYDPELEAYTDVDPSTGLFSRLYEEFLGLSGRATAKA